MTKSAPCSKISSLSAWVLQHVSVRPTASVKSKWGFAKPVDVRLSVVNVSSDGEPLVVGRLADLGILAGEEISYFGRAPMGDPVFVSVRDTVIALRTVEAELIEVRELNFLTEASDR